MCRSRRTPSTASNACVHVTAAEGPCGGEPVVCEVAPVGGAGVGFFATRSGRADGGASVCMAPSALARLGGPPQRPRLQGRVRRRPFLEEAPVPDLRLGVRPPSGGDDPVVVRAASFALLRGARDARGARGLRGSAPARRAGLVSTDPHPSSAEERTRRARVRRNGHSSPPLMGAVGGLRGLHTLRRGRTTEA
jgi:hypothetical protein